MIIANATTGPLPTPSSACNLQPPPPTPKPDSEDLHLNTKHSRVPDRDGRRFCRVCNDFVPTPSSACNLQPPPPTPKPDSEDLHLYKPRPRVPDRDGRRFCRVCNDFLPVSAFPSGQRRYTCRAHLWERVGRPAKQTLLAKPRKRLLARLWMQCYKDRGVFGHTRVALTQAELDAMLAAAGAGAGAAKFAVLPRDPRQPISRDNAVLVPQEDRRALLALARRRALDTTTLACRK
jgi:hypothetical protein